MAKWFDQAREIDRLRSENQRLLSLAEQLKIRLGDSAANTDIYGVSDEEKQAVADGRPVEAIKKYRERTGADLLTAKRAIDSVS
ncbi:hypothetical protein [Corynebacterium sanguinis]|uniref:50S ribosomal protein L7/L12 n=1 Tax=Corynebacterium sanguinis TaxID=2594913 RepID=A0A6C1TWZ1_9CORY|nr:hypothetical protein [Corynebacterium sanguinis]MBA4506014.1 50S ribosomal protein L7/L12 [Corynebacterium sanguinis]MCT1414761.1 hypothetical protein [Corynebacterium sanguinis]MCT1424709.1 hypothetical protein [Corynebacterium sanguinis]MCT1498295.1 hypothetical protein [Corynebacterium sanguinis]MCT1596529.1 hypothetical protein [Corynebacterium sanguinis]